MSGGTLVNGRADGAIDPADRGLTYGDGLFETIRFRNGAAPLWSRHMERLASGCKRLALPMPAGNLLLAESLAAVEDMADAVVRLSLTRGAGPRGYRPPASPQVTRIVTASAMPAELLEHQGDGVSVGFSKMQLARQPALAGLKHLNRLEQVLASAELAGTDCDEALLFDTEGCLISAISANLFLVLNGVLATPSLNHCGVAGVARAEVLAHCTLEGGPDIEPNNGDQTLVRVGEFFREDLMRADEVFLTNSVRGVMPVGRIEGRELAAGAHGRRWQRHWQGLFEESTP